MSLTGGLVAAYASGIVWGINIGIALHRQKYAFAAFCAGVALLLGAIGVYSTTRKP